MLRLLSRNKLGRESLCKADVDSQGASETREDTKCPHTPAAGSRTTETGVRRRRREVIYQSHLQPWKFRVPRILKYPHVLDLEAPKPPK
ncbi:hypothetical protein J6590_029952 [Homalodisca vitripennis]|nr:hypothetical protein J6590_029952 [Homalodisca vitripennis]